MAFNARRTDRSGPKQSCTAFHGPKAEAKNAIRVPPNRITVILRDDEGITADTAIRLGMVFKTSAEFWMNLQITYDLRQAEKAPPARVRKSIEDNRSMLA